MSAYWLSFRINEDAGYSDAYKALNSTVEACVSGDWWFETTSFYMFESQLKADAIAERIGRAIRLDRDLVVLGMTEFKTGRVIGNCEDQDIFRIAPFMKKV